MKITIVIEKMCLPLFQLKKINFTVSLSILNTLLFKFVVYNINVKM